MGTNGSSGAVEAVTSGLSVKEDVDDDSAFEEESVLTISSNEPDTELADGECDDDDSYNINSNDEQEPYDPRLIHNTELVVENEGYIEADTDENGMKDAINQYGDMGLGLGLDDDVTRTLQLREHLMQQL